MVRRRDSRVEKEWLLILPLDRKGLHQSRQRERGRVISIQDGVDNVGSQKRHAQDTADVGRIDLLGFGDLFDCRVQVASGKLKKAKSFAELHHIVAKEIGPIRGIGDLAVYDIAHRIGAYLGREPEAVYLHAGTPRRRPCSKSYRQYRDA
jgi:hypothetical protein